MNRAAARHAGPLASSLILAVVWFGWHLPQFFVIATYRDSAPVQYVGMFLGPACGSVVLTWLYNRSGDSILLVAIWHGLYNFVISLRQAMTPGSEASQVKCWRIPRILYASRPQVKLFLAGDATVRAWTAARATRRCFSPSPNATWAPSVRSTNATPTGNVLLGFAA